MTERFAEIGRHSQLKQLALFVVIIVLGGEHHDRRAPQSLVVARGECDEYFFPTDAGHHIIKQDEIRVQFACQAQPVASVSRADKFVTRAFQTDATEPA